MLSEDEIQSGILQNGFPDRVLSIVIKLIDSGYME